MARQVGKIFITGNVDDICFYKMDGKFYARKKSSLNKKRVLTDPKFQNTIAHTQLLAKASVIASKLYRSIEKEKRSRQLYRSIVGKAIKLLREGVIEREVELVIGGIVRGLPKPASH